MRDVGNGQFEICGGVDGPGGQSMTLRHKYSAAEDELDIDVTMGDKVFVRIAVRETSDYGGTVKAKRIPDQYSVIQEDSTERLRILKEIAGECVSVIWLGRKAQLNV